MLVGFLLLISVVFCLSWCIILCNKDEEAALKSHQKTKTKTIKKREKKKKKSTSKETSKTKGKGRMPQGKKKSSGSKEMTMTPSKEITTAPNEEKKSREKEEQPEKKKHEEAASLKFGPIVEEEHQPSATDLDDIPDDKNPLLDQSVQKKLLPEEVLARKTTTIESDRGSNEKMTPVRAKKSKADSPAPPVEKTQKSETPSLYADEELNPKMSTPPQHSDNSKKAKANEIHSTDALKGPKKKTSRRKQSKDAADINHEHEHK